TAAKETTLFASVFLVIATAIPRLGNPLHICMSDMTIQPIDEVWVTVQCGEALAHELSDYFTFKPENAHFMRRQARYRGWDGSVRLFKLRDHRIYRGLVPRILEFAEQHQYSVDNQVPEVFPFLPDEAFDGWQIHMEQNGFAPFEIRPYQRDALRFCLDNYRGIVVSPTGSGKSYIIWLLTQAISVPQTLIIVPTTGLVQQMHSDFVSYGCDPNDIQTIQGGMSKAPNSPLVISTWQSIYELPANYFRQFGCVICDEVHLAKAKSLTGLLEKCVEVPYRFGFTGTINETEVHRLILEGLFGSVMQVTTTNELVKAQQLAPIRVDMCVLKYPESVRKLARHYSYQEEVDFLVSDPARALCVATLVSKLKGNTLVLFNLIDRHGKQLYEQIRLLCPERSVHFVTGIVDAGDREEVRQTVETDTDGEHIIVASFGVFSTGVNLRRLHNLVFAAAGKSKIRTLQSIGRGLRTHSSKNHVTLYDIVDDLRVGARRNYAWKHAEQRSVLYAEEKFPVTIHAIDLERFALKASPTLLASPTLDGPEMDSATLDETDDAL
ncbi:MAG: DEAD/DEAH box helicase family protein, partial [Patescibacteria group bacterium]|nr:DEAD/DEAH box helicase family protein [Patescibacteria group bacterium]